MVCVNLLEILLDGSRPAGEIQSRAIGYMEERRVDKTVIMTAAGAVGAFPDVFQIFAVADDLSPIAF